MLNHQKESKWISSVMKIEAEKFINWCTEKFESSCFNLATDFFRHRIIKNRLNLNSVQIKSILVILWTRNMVYNRRPCWRWGVLIFFWLVTVLNQSDCSIDQSNCKTVVTCQNKFPTLSHQYGRRYKFSLNFEKHWYGPN